MNRKKLLIIVAIIVVLISVCAAIALIFTFTFRSGLGHLIVEENSPRKTVLKLPEEEQIYSFDVTPDEKYIYYMSHIDFEEWTLFALNLEDESVEEIELNTEDGILGTGVYAVNDDEIATFIFKRDPVTDVLYKSFYIFDRDGNIINEYTEIPDFTDESDRFCDRVESNPSDFKYLFSADLRQEIQLEAVIDTENNEFSYSLCLPGQGEIEANNGELRKIILKNNFLESDITNIDNQLNYSEVFVDGGVSIIKAIRTAKSTYEGACISQETSIQYKDSKYIYEPTECGGQFKLPESLNMATNLYFIDIDELNVIYGFEE